MSDKNEKFSDTVFNKNSVNDIPKNEIKKVEQPKAENDNRQWRKVLEEVLPFVILILYTFCTAGIYYGVENAACDVVTFSSTTSTLNIGHVLTYWAAFHFIVTLETTIGFGDVFPCSLWGQFLAIIFSLMGIPLTMVCLAKLAGYFHLLLRKLHSKIKSMKSTKKAENIKTSEEKLVPLWLGLIVIILWILLSAIFFFFTIKDYYTPEMSFFSAIYFCVITYLTIGLGDISPVGYTLAFFIFIFIMIGLALVATMISLVQAKLDALFDKVDGRIRDEYKKRLADEDKARIAENGPHAENSVNALFSKDPESKWYKPFMSTRNKEQLVNNYQNYGKLVCQDTQSDTPDIDAIALDPISNKEPLEDFRYSYSKEISPPNLLDNKESDANKIINRTPEIQKNIDSKTKSNFSGEPTDIESPEDEFSFNPKPQLAGKFKRQLKNVNSGEKTENVIPQSALSVDKFPTTNELSNNPAVSQPTNVKKSRYPRNLVADNNQPKEQQNGGQPANVKVEEKNTEEVSKNRKKWGRNLVHPS